MNSLVFIFLVASVLFAAAIAEKKVCWMKRFGELTMFNGVKHDVELPCMYLLADFRCDGYRIKVQVSNRPDDGGYSPEYLNVDVTRVSDKASFQTRTSGPLLKKFYKNLVDEPWTDTSGDKTIVSFLGNSSHSAVVRVVGGATVKFTIPRSGDSGAVTGVKVTCDSVDLKNAKDFSDATLCGGPSTDINALQLYKESNGMSSASFQQAMHYLVLGAIDGARQSQLCFAVAEEFQKCPNKHKRGAVKACEAIFGNRPLNTCLADTASSTYKHCLEYVCTESGGDPTTTIAAECRQHL